MSQPIGRPPDAPEGSRALVPRAGDRPPRAAMLAEPSEIKRSSWSGRSSAPSPRASRTSSVPCEASRVISSRMLLPFTPAPGRGPLMQGAHGHRGLDDRVTGPRVSPAELTMRTLRLAAGQRPLAAISLRSRRSAGRAWSAKPLKSASRAGLAIQQPRRSSGRGARSARPGAGPRRRSEPGRRRPPALEAVRGHGEREGLLEPLELHVRIATFTPVDASSSRAFRAPGVVLERRRQELGTRELIDDLVERLLLEVAATWMSPST